VQVGDTVVGVALEPLPDGISLGGAGLLFEEDTAGAAD
jgi:hypothetical protein